MSNVMTSYKLGTRQAIIHALEQIFNDPTYPDAQLANRIHPTLEYPITDTMYPAVYVTFDEETIRNAGIGHYDHVDGTSQVMAHWVFTGGLNFHILALTDKDRDMVASAILSMLSFNEFDAYWNKFRTAIFNGQYVALQPLMHDIHPLGDQTAQAPFGGEDDLVFATTYSVPIFGEFFSDVSNEHHGQLILITNINAYGYNIGGPDPQPPPTGTPDPAPWT